MRNSNAPGQKAQQPSAEDSQHERPPAAVAPRVASGPLTKRPIIGHRPPQEPLPQLRWLCLLAAGMMVVRTLSLQIAGLLFYALILIVGGSLRREAVAVRRA